MLLQYLLQSSSKCFITKNDSITLLLNKITAMITLE